MKNQLLLIAISLIFGFLLLALAAELFSEQCPKYEPEFIPIEGPVCPKGFPFDYSYDYWSGQKLPLTQFLLNLLIYTLPIYLLLIVFVKKK